MVGGLHNKGTGTMVESVVGGVLRQIGSRISVCFRIYYDQAHHSIYRMHHGDALKAAEHYGGFEKDLSPKFLDAMSKVSLMT
jgi:hypothetical protein